MSVQASREDPRLITAIMSYGGRCRDCADNNGICEGSGLPCEPELARKAVRHVLAALSYYERYPHFVECFRDSGRHPQGEKPQALSGEAVPERPNEDSASPNLS